MVMLGAAGVARFMTIAVAVLASRQSFMKCMMAVVKRLGVVMK